MEAQEWLSDFYEAIGAQGEIGVSHISLYLALAHQVQTEGGVNPIFVFRNDIATRARISRRTFNRCIRDLQQLGYLQYEPSTENGGRSKVFLKKL